jgi:hypothetical protein
VPLEADRLISNAGHLKEASRSILVREIPKVAATHGLGHEICASASIENRDDLLDTFYPIRCRISLEEVRDQSAPESSSECHERLADRGRRPLDVTARFTLGGESGSRPACWEIRLRQQDPSDPATQFIICDDEARRMRRESRAAEGLLGFHGCTVRA